jgi:hypothetical protein
MEDYPNFKDNLSKIMQYFPGERPPIVLWFNAVLHHLENNSQKESLFLNRLQDEYETNKSGSPAWFIALYYFVKEDADQGFQWLQRSYDQHEVEMTWLREEPVLIPYRGDPRYQKVYEKIGFPDIPRASNI